MLYILYKLNDKVTFNPNFNETTLQNDTAFSLLHEAVEFNKYIQPIFQSLERFVPKTA
uniref:Uncharacterized protein n=1 Tax=Tetranychus urticae TaxID=32264 RepID=T1L3B0_TETUR